MRSRRAMVVASLVAALCLALSGVAQETAAVGCAANERGAAVAAPAMKASHGTHRLARVHSALPAVVAAPDHVLPTPRALESAGTATDSRLDRPSFLPLRV